MQTITASVGRDGVNRYSDVVLIQHLLNQYDIPDELIPLKVDGQSGQKTEDRIEAFQRHLLGMSHPDGRVDVDGRTLRRLIEIRAGARAVTALDISIKAIELLKAIETLATEPYDDQTGEEVDHWVRGATIGYGHLIGRDEWPRFAGGITEAQAEQLFQDDLQPFLSALRSVVTVPLKPQEFDALIIFMFNIGRSAFANSSVLRLINNPAARTRYPSLEQAWKAWNKSQGRISRGLQNRRNAEWNIYAHNIYERW